MLYSLVRPLAKTAFLVFFHKIYLSNQERIPKDKPVILSCNHPTGFMEPCILATMLDRPLYFLVRGDFFKKPIYEKLLRALHMLPVFRLKDGGYRNLKNNFSTFEACHRALDENRTIMIFAEGGTKYEKRLRPLQKGLARIAFGTLENYPGIEDVYVVPCGATYTGAHQFRSEVMIDFGEALSTRAYFEQYGENPAEAIAALTHELEARMQACIVHIERPEDDRLVENLLLTERSERIAPLFPLLSTREAPLRREQTIAGKVNDWPARARKELLKKADLYFEQLKALGLEDRDVAGGERPSSGRYLFLILGFLPALAGFLFNFLPARLGKLLADKKVGYIEFYGPVMLASAIAFYLIYYLLLVFFFALKWGWAGLLALAGFALLGLFAVFYFEQYRTWQSWNRGKGLSAGEKEALRELRSELLAAVRRPSEARSA